MSEQDKQLLPSYLCGLFNYDSDTGQITWKESRQHHVKDGQIAGSIDGKGRIRIEINGKTYAAHQIAFAIYHGRWATHQVDHINGDKLDNRIINLREATNAENSRNRPSKGKSGYRGVSFHKRTGLYHARIMTDGKKMFLGAFVCPKVAAIAYNNAAKELHGKFATLNNIGS